MWPGDSKQEVGVNADFDLVVRGGTIFDGSGGEPMEADVGIVGGVITAIGKLGRGAEEIDAFGKLVTPGFIDVHTHLDGQATWENRLGPSTLHGVTTVVSGNCGVGFAPCKAEDRDDLIRLMEGVEDIPGIVMADGLPWNWESFGDYLDVLDGRSLDADIAAYVPHSALRVFVMGKRGVAREPATTDDLSRMRSLVTEAVQAGAIGVSTSRFLEHRSKSGDLAPSVKAAEAELMALAGGLKDAGRGILQLMPDWSVDPDEEFALMSRMVQMSERPLSFTLSQVSDHPDNWRRYLDLLAAHQGPAPIRAQVFPRPVGVLMGLELSSHPFMWMPSYKAIAHLPIEERVVALRDPALRARILSEQPDTTHPMDLMLASALPHLYRLGNPVCYDPLPEQRFEVLAAKQGCTAADIAYDAMLEQDGRAVLYWPAANFHDRNLQAVRQLMASEHTIFGLGDSGAHYGFICDGSYPTFVLTRWVRDALPGEALRLSEAIQQLSRTPSEAVGMHDRGLLAPGMLGDVNVIDFDALALGQPHPLFDLPAGGLRLTQNAAGYSATIKRGIPTYIDGQPTGALPGKLLRM